MQKSTRRLLIISALVFSLWGCSSSPVKNAARIAEVPAVFNSSYFSTDADYVYKANILVYGKSLSGILIAKKTGSGHRVVFTTEFGNKLIDVEVSPASFKVNYIVPELDRKILVNTLRSDFQLLFRQQFPLAEAYSVDGQIVYKSPDNHLINYLHIADNPEKLLKISRWNRRKEQISITFTSQNNIFARNILVKHSDIKLSMEFNLINQTN